MQPSDLSKMTLRQLKKLRKVNKNKSLKDMIKKKQDNYFIKQFILFKDVIKGKQND